jgi:hypothetical protein
MDYLIVFETIMADDLDRIIKSLTGSSIEIAGAVINKTRIEFHWRYIRRCTSKFHGLHLLGKYIIIVIYEAGKS